MPAPLAQRLASPALALALLLGAPAPPASADADAPAAGTGAGAAAGAIRLRVHGLRCDAGSVRVKLVKDGRGFPASNRHVVEKRKLRARAGGVELHLGAVPYGDYALVVLHDEDDDAELDRSWFGIPREGLGFSSGARVRFGPPGYEEARFTLAEPELRMEIEVRYP